MRPRVRWNGLAPVQSFAHLPVGEERSNVTPFALLLLGRCRGQAAKPVLARAQMAGLHLTILLFCEDTVAEPHRVWSELLTNRPGVRNLESCCK